MKEEIIQQITYKHNSENIEVFSYIVDREEFLEKYKDALDEWLIEYFSPSIQFAKFTYNDKEYDMFFVNFTAFVAIDKMIVNEVSYDVKNIFDVLDVMSTKEEKEISLYRNNMILYEGSIDDLIYKDKLFFNIPYNWGV